MLELKIILYSSQKSQCIIYQDYDFEWANKNIDENHIKHLSKAIANATEKFIHVPKTEDFTRGDFATLYNYSQASEG